MEKPEKKELGSRNEQELTLPIWIKEDPEAGDKGKLLYIEEWATKRTHKLVIDKIFWLGPFICSFIIFPLGLLSMLSGNVAGIGLFLMGIVTLVLSIGFFATGSYMPFCIYEHGFSTPFPSLKNRFRHVELFVPWRDVQSITVRANFMGAAAILIHVGQKRPIELNFQTLTDPYQAMLILDSTVPNKLATDFSRFIIRHLFEEIIRDPFKTKFIDKRWIVFLFFGIMMLLIAIGISNKAYLEGKLELLYVPPLILFSSLALIFFYISIMPLDYYSQRDYIRKQSVMEPNGIGFPVTAMGNRLKKIRSPIPWNCISRAEVKLESHFYTHQAMITTFSRERFLIPFEIFEKLPSIDDFEYSDGIFVNRTKNPDQRTIDVWQKRFSFGWYE